ncbi:MAG TPA: homoserine dehydrogenase, partial [Deltaproteobacteria bacterium]|nr:homoserine dehydrogenase [Deltaproteobacteria bacterium]
MKTKTISIGLAGFGTVGGGVYEILRKHRALLARRVGAPLQIKKIAVRSKGKRRPGAASSALFTENLQDILQDPEIPIVVEVMGGTREAKAFAFAAIRAGKHLVTANKALIALHGKELFLAAKQAQVDVCFEAAVAGGIPVLRALREGFVANEIRSLFGIVNGTCNFILSEMSQAGADFAGTLQRAQQLGYAEAD